MELLQKLERQGIKIKLADNERLILTPKDKLTSELIEKVRANKQILIATLSGKIQSDEHEKSTMGKAKKITPRASQHVISENKATWLCRRSEPPRWVNVAVCGRHVSEADIKCIACPHLTIKNRQVWMNSLLDKAIAALNDYYAERGFTRTPPRNEHIDRLEKQITETFERGDMQEFKKSTDKWEQCFRENCQ